MLFPLTIGPAELHCAKHAEEYETSKLGTLIAKLQWVLSSFMVDERFVGGPKYLGCGELSFRSVTVFASAP